MTNSDRTTNSGPISDSVVQDSLSEIIDPCSAATGSNLNIVEMGLIKSIDIENGHVCIDMRLTSPVCHMVPYFAEEVKDRVGSLQGVNSVELETDAGFEWDESMMSEGAKQKRQAVLDEHATRFQEERGIKNTS